MILGKIFSNFSKNPVSNDSNSYSAKELQKTNQDLLNASLDSLSSESLSNTAKGSFQAMQNLQKLNQQLHEQVNNQQKDK